MLFDLQSGKRRRMVQIVYSLLAASFLIGFVIFGVGSGGIGSLSDIFGGNGSGSGNAASQYDDAIDHAQATLAKNPKNQKALIDLATNEYHKGSAELGGPDASTGAPYTLTESAHTDLGAATDAWARYLKVAKKPDAGAAQIMVGAYVILNDAAGAAKTQQIVVDANPNPGTYNQLAYYLYFVPNIPAADAAAKKAVALAPAEQRKTVKKQFAQLHDQAVKLAKQQKKQAQAGSASGAPSPLSSPFGGLGSAPGSTAPAPSG